MARFLRRSVLPAPPLIDLTSIALKKLGLRRADLIDTDASEYPITRKWASRLYEDHTDAEGLLWTSRQDDRAQAVVLFEPRLRGLSFIPVNGPQPLLMPDGSARSEVWIWQTAGSSAGVRPVAIIL